jgi:hypothetical protein
MRWGLYFQTVASKSSVARYCASTKENEMVDATKIKAHANVIGADGVHLGTVDHVEGDRIKLTKRDSGEGTHKGHHHFISLGLVADVEGNDVRLSANADVALTFEEEQNGSAAE